MYAYDAQGYGAALSPSHGSDSKYVYILCEAQKIAYEVLFLSYHTYLPTVRSTECYHIHVMGEEQPHNPARHKHAQLGLCKFFFVLFLFF